MSHIGNGDTGWASWRCCITFSINARPEVENRVTQPQKQDGAGCTKGSKENPVVLMMILEPSGGSAATKEKSDKKKMHKGPRSHVKRPIYTGSEFYVR